MRSKGSFALARVGKTARDLAAELDAPGVDHTAVVRWISGERKPTKPQRAAVATTYGIAEPLWDEPIDPAPVVTADPEGDPATVDELAGRIARQVERSIRELEHDPAVTPAERDKRLASLTMCVQRLRAEDLSPAQIIRAPATQRILSAIIEALQPFPDALDAAAKRLAALEAEGEG